MHFRVSEWLDDQPDERTICPYRVLDPATGNIISQVTEFNDDEGWVRVLCRHPDWLERRTDSSYVHPDQDVLVSQIRYLPFQVVPFYDGIDELPKVYIDTITYQDGRPVGDWISNDQPHRHQPENEV